MMKVMGLRWGEDKLDCAFNAELKVVDGDDKELYFSAGSIDWGLVDGWITDHSIIEELNNVDGDPADINKYYGFGYEECEDDEDNEDQLDGPYKNVIKFLLYALSKNSDFAADDEGAKEFITPYIGKDIDTMDIPMPRFNKRLKNTEH